jgi:very-short-patch-repair endonuclease
MQTRRTEIRKARVLRRWAPEPQVILWQALRNRQVAGLRFRRGAPVGDRIVDFHCPAARLVVEVTGKAQDRQTITRRDAELRAMGLQVFRLQRERVLDDLPGVLIDIAALARRI